MSINLLVNQNYKTTMSKLLPGSNIYLIGMMGSGKTTIGKCLVEDLKDLKDLNYCFVDTDQEIEAKENRTIKEIFKTEGEAYFRKLETEVLKDLSDKTNHVIATGGGIIQQKNNYNWKYVQKGLTIWLDVDLEILKQRLAEDETRPLANDLESRLAFRRPFYAQSDIQIAIHQEQPPKEVSAQIKKMIPTVLKSQV
jgi:shikimate kinase